MTNRPAPVIDDDSRPFWQGTARQQLRLPYCRACAAAFFYPRALCPRCHGDDLEWRNASGRGTVYSYTVSRRPAGPAFQAITPYVVALVDLEEGPRLLTNVLVDRPDQVHIGQSVTVVYQPLGDGETVLPLFQPEAAPER
ncbi:Zn-ribbon domain-containing OB-fold protein [Alloalcanivorax mobilis]|uniref:Zn-ribbon domain-containing OB-fold protein n=1 Tax=Alloalcanivorax mobilis TaxID=2019569 RepID=UPI000C75DEAC|nr:Zn-ribbon domain-containing OB-fold protein [Alloalcanivorax mobilis]